MPYELLEHEADMGIKGVGESWEEAFAEGAKAMFSIMAELNKIEKKKNIEIKCQAQIIPELFVEWLNELIAQRDLTGLIFKDFEVVIEKVNDTYQLAGKAFGESLNQNKHQIKTEVKAATYSGLRCEEKNGQFYCQCVVDI